MQLRRRRELTLFFTLFLSPTGSFCRGTKGTKNPFKGGYPPLTPKRARILQQFLSFPAHPRRNVLRLPRCRSDEVTCQNISLFRCAWCSCVIHQSYRSGTPKREQRFLLALHERQRRGSFASSASTCRPERNRLLQSVPFRGFQGVSPWQFLDTFVWTKVSHRRQNNAAKRINEIGE